MNLQHVVVVNQRLHEVQAANSNRLVLGAGKQFAIADFKTGRMVFRHVLTGRFMSTRIRG